MILKIDCVFAPAVLDAIIPAKLMVVEAFINVIAEPPAAPESIVSAELPIPRLLSKIESIDPVVVALVTESVPVGVDVPIPVLPLPSIVRA